ncbi:SMP-30/gluconolactonase/LRE family protein [Mesorhizobium sp. CU2]|uniref:SMP-30/gluconolactonase/LRE family protein n=1 Tax=unclassified Mesorhizobium TaxID=325217 RepID=UPI001129C49D|nr:MULTISPECIES: SMP-30/gluconolactonase/LRE family protein [unclassified Mesorhizobium]TPN81088.1 SMP-30/gluconolactonase/LRE family protein [Mesorhizobium sp. CU3]TPO11691.1 SMP-30/gluconolactonase/LRE family protein [Mesorhizobium sp. CU2]
MPADPTIHFAKCIDFEMRLGESPVWDVDRQRLWFVDILAPAVYAFDPLSRETNSYPMPTPVGSIAIADRGRLVVALRTGVHLFDPASGVLEFLVHPEPDISVNRLNDGKVGPDGCFWVGSMHDALPRAPSGALYRVTPEGRCTKIIDGLFVSNGLAWSPDGKTMYHADSRAAYVRAYDFDREGRISNGRSLATFAESDGLPDGAAVDVEGNYWTAGVTAGVLSKLSPDGQRLDIIRLPVRAPTMPCFGGRDLKTMFITSLATDRGGSHQPGTLVSAELKVTGLATPVFGAVT